MEGFFTRKTDGNGDGLIKQFNKEACGLGDEMNKFELGAVTAALALTVHHTSALELNMYGVGHLSADNVDDGDNSSIHVTSSSSRLGFAGEHKINSKLTVIFQLESGVDLTAQGENDGNGGANSEGQVFTKGRPSYVGLSGSYGKILIGHMPALDQWVNDYNLFADQVGDLGNLWEGSGVPGRLDNVIYYATPEVGNFDAALTYVPEEGVDDADHVILKGNYSSDQLKIGVAFANIGQGSASSDDHRAVAVTVAYDFGRYSIGGGYQQELDIGGVSGDDRSSFSLGGSVKVGDNGRFKVQFANSSGEGSDSDATLFAVGYDHSLGPDTTVYAAYSNMDNDNNVAFSANGKGHGDKVTPATGDDPSALSLGIVYKFDVGLLK